MAKAVRSDDVHSLFTHAIQGKKHNVPAMQNKMVKQQLPPQMNLPVVGHLVARDLSIIWSDDSRYWKWKTMEICNGRSIDVAELLDVCWLKIDGKYKVQELTEGMHYKVMFVVKLLDNLNIDKPVSFSLTTPDGSKQEHTENMMDMPRNQIIGITAGEFQAKACGCGEINFTMMNTDGFWKRGMVVIGTLLLPKD